MFKISSALLLSHLLIVSASALAQDPNTSTKVPEELPQLGSKGTQKTSLTGLKFDHFGDKVKRQFISGQNGMLAWFTLAKGAEVPWHTHEAEQISHVISGEMILTVGIDEKEYRLKRGDIIVIPPHVPHKGRALVDTVEIDVFSPIRKDWLEGTDQYLQDID
ncbi:cupin domain-containing protein [Agaribacter marinus]|uniref:Cupin type-2 domain-containing protein n=1 Tax=Agaribacter marinus TaxID=1431249 RepID=A0AA37SXE2_9ALTE|nr:cupin domain-containing protein [Agaribacter marinus]GLR70259.1 hypothetical protein GCM10007852_11670 [Agaribacter marinus]